MEGEGVSWLTGSEWWCGSREGLTNSATSFALPLRESLWTLDLSFSVVAGAAEAIFSGRWGGVVDVGGIVEFEVWWKSADGFGCLLGAWPGGWRWRRRCQGRRYSFLEGSCTTGDQPGLGLVEVPRIWASIRYQESTAKISTFRVQVSILSSQCSAAVQLSPISASHFSWTALKLLLKLQNKMTPKLDNTPAMEPVTFPA